MLECSRTWKLLTNNFLQKTNTLMYINLHSKCSKTKTNNPRPTTTTFSLAKRYFSIWFRWLRFTRVLVSFPTAQNFDLFILLFQLKILYLFRFLIILIFDRICDQTHWKKITGYADNKWSKVFLACHSLTHSVSTFHFFNFSIPSLLSYHTLSAWLSISIFLHNNRV